MENFFGLRLRTERVSMSIRRRGIIARSRPMWYRRASFIDAITILILCLRYDANYCSGDCPMAFLPAYPNTHIVSLAEPPNNSGPCCAPRKLSEITMLYFDNEYQIVFSRLPGMVVEKCGCS